jgi:hypothetical protein
MRARGESEHGALIEAWNDAGSTFPDDPVEPRPGLSPTFLADAAGKV